MQLYLVPSLLYSNLINVLKSELPDEFHYIGADGSKSVRCTLCVTVLICYHP